MLTPVFRAYDNYFENKKLMQLKKIEIEKKEKEKKKKEEERLVFELKQRELKEETSVKSVKLIKEINYWIHYDLPSNLVRKIWKGKFRGQKQKWFLMKFMGEDKEINLKTKRPEFIEWKWISVKDLTDVVVEFKLEVYKKVQKEIVEIVKTI